MFKRRILFVVCMFISVFGYSQIQWLSSFDEAKDLALEQNKLIVVDCWATWCGPCARMDQDVWDQDAMKIYADKFVFVKLDLSSGFANPDFTVKGVPNVFIVDAWKHVYNKVLGYRQLSAMKAMLNDLCFECKDIYKLEKEVHSDKSDENKLLELAMCYQKCYTNIKTRTRFLLRSQSVRCFKKSEKIAGKKKNKELVQTINLLSSLNKSPKKRMKVVNSVKPVNDKLKNIKEAILVKTYAELGDKKKASEIFLKVKDVDLPYYDFLSAERKQL